MARVATLRSRRRATLLRAPLTVLLAAATGVGGLDAQTITGRLLTAYRDAPIEMGRVDLISEAGRVVVSTLTDADGRFTLSASDGGRYSLRGTAAWHAPLTEGPVELRAGQTLAVELRLMPEAVELDTLGVSVEGRLPELARAGYYERQRSGFGFFLDQEEIGRRNASEVGYLLQGIPGVDISRRGPGPPKVYLRRRVSFTGGRSCVPSVYVDGFLYQSHEDDASGVNDVKPEDIAGIEVYTSQLRVPPAYAHGLTGCGVILIWLK